MKLLALLIAVAATALAAYPSAPRGTAVSTYFGTQVSDPYRWLEDVRASTTRSWVSAQGAFTARELNRLPRRAALRASVIRLMNQHGDSVPQWGGNVMAFERGDGSGRRPVVVTVHNGRTHVLLDPNLRWRDGVTSLADWQLAPDGRALAYATKHGGAGFVAWHVLDVQSGRDRPDRVVGTPDWAPIAWTHDGSGFYYGAYRSGKAPLAGAPIGSGYSANLHRLNAPQATDQVIYARPDHPTWLPYAQESTDGRSLIVGAIDGAGEGTLIAVRSLHGSNGKLQLLRPLSDARYDYVDSVGSLLYFFTNANAPLGKLVAIDLNHPQQERDVISQKRATLQDVTPVGGRFIARYLHDVRSELTAFARDGRRLGTIPLPGPGSVEQVVGDAQRPLAYYRFSSPTTPPTTFSYDSRTAIARVVSRQSAPFNLSAYTTKELFARSADGTRIPVFVAYRRDRPLNGSTPTLLTGYGGFGDSYKPSWSTAGAAWLANGGTYAIACVRGGGEYGEQWHRAGMLGKKQNVFDDFAAAARLLIKRRFASTKTLGSYGHSGGGLLVGVTEVQHPELFGAVVESAGPVDVLRGYTYGTESAWIGEVGSPIASAEQFAWLYRYAPLVHMRRGARYPATLVMTSSNDDRVSPAHAYKFAASLQWAQSGKAPILLYVALGTGHIGGGSVYSEAAPIADAEAFLLDHLGHSLN